MEIRVVIADDGSVSLGVPEGEFADASTALTDLVNAIKAQGIDLESGQPEQHKHAYRPVDVRVDSGR